MVHWDSNQSENINIEDINQSQWEEPRPPVGLRRAKVKKKCKNNNFDTTKPLHTKYAYLHFGFGIS